MKAPCSILQGNLVLSPPASSSSPSASFLPLRTPLKCQEFRISSRLKDARSASGIAFRLRVLKSALRGGWNFGATGAAINADSCVNNANNKLIYKAGKKIILILYQSNVDGKKHYYVTIICRFFRDLAKGSKGGGDAGTVGRPRVNGCDLKSFLVKQRKNARREMSNVNRVGDSDPVEKAHEKGCARGGGGGWNIRVARTMTREYRLILIMESVQVKRSIFL